MAHWLADYVRWLKRFQGTSTGGRSSLIGQISAKRFSQVSSRDIVAGLFSNTLPQAQLMIPLYTLYIGVQDCLIRVIKAPLRRNKCIIGDTPSLASRDSAHSIGVLQLFSSTSLQVFYIAHRALKALQPHPISLLKYIYPSYQYKPSLILQLLDLGGRLID